MNIKSDIKAKIVESGFTMSQVIDAMNKKYNRNDSVQNLSNKLSRESIKYKEVLEILDIIGYEIKIQKK